MKRKIQKKKKKEDWEIRFQKIDEAIAKFAEESKLAISKLSEENRKTSEENKKTAEELKQLSKELRDFKNSINRLTDSWGRFVEGIVEPSVVKFLQEQGFRILEIYQRAKFSRNGKNKEYDLIVVCDKNSVFVVSAKTHVSSRDVKELIVDMEEFPFFVQRYKGMNLYGIIAGVNYGRGADVFALRAGLYVMKVSDEIMQVQNPKMIKVVSL